MKHIHVSLAMIFLAITSGFAAPPSAPPAPQPAVAPINGTVPELLVAAGSSSGTYEAFIKEIKQFTSEAVIFTDVQPPSHGAVENLDRLINNKAQVALMHSDVIYFRGQSAPGGLPQFKTLLDLFPEEVHFLALSQSKRVVGGKAANWAGFGAQPGQPITVNNIEDLKGLRVGAAGGGFITAQVIRLMGQVGYDVVKFGSGKDVLAALNSGDIDAAVFVGGAPLPNLQDLGPEYKLLPVPERTAQMLKAVYRSATVTYTRMRPDTVPTIAADCLLIAREYKTPRFVNALRSFRKQFYERLTEMQETPNVHPKWQEVKPDNGTPETRGKWPWMDL